MPVKDQAAYMRGYRARKRDGAENALEATIAAEADDIRAASELIVEVERLRQEVIELLGEVAHLKRELALTHTLVGPLTTTRSGSFGRSYPAPKPGRK